MARAIEGQNIQDNQDSQPRTRKIDFGLFGEAILAASIVAAGVFGGGKLVEHASGVQLGQQQTVEQMLEAVIDTSNFPEK